MLPGLRPEQGPPFAIPLAFFLAAPPWLALAGLIMALAPETWTTSRWHPVSLALAHLVGLGFLGLVMLGALSQMLPVAAGARLPHTARLGWASVVLVSLGAPALAYGMTTGDAWLLGAPLVALGLGVTAVAGLWGLSHAPRGATRTAMALALAALLAVAVLGLGLSGWLAGSWQPVSLPTWIDLHVGLALAGWVGLLVIGSAYPVVPMLQITPNYPAWLTRVLAPGLAGLLALWAGARAMEWPGLSDLAGAGVILALLGFAAVTLDLQRRRKRKRGDATLRLWRLGMASLLAAGLLSLLGPRLMPAQSESWSLVVGVLFLLGFASAVVHGMLLKIVPFLAWFHLQAQSAPGRSEAGGMKGFIPDRQGDRLFWLHAGAVALLVAAPAWPVLSVPGGLLLALGALWLEYWLWQTRRRFLALGGRTR